MELIIAKQEGYHTLSHIKELIPDQESEMYACDDLLQSIEIVNEGNVEPDWTVGRLDVAALYPLIEYPNMRKSHIRQTIS